MGQTQSLDQFVESEEDPTKIFDSQPTDSIETMQILGGPGTGKTSLIAGLDGVYDGIISNLRDNGYEPNQIIIATFSNSQARDLRSQLPEIAEENNIATLDALAHRSVDASNDKIIGNPTHDLDKIEEFRSEYVSGRSGERLQYTEDSDPTICGEIHDTHEYLSQSNLEITLSNIIRSDANPARYNVSYRVFVDLVRNYRQWLIESKYDTFGFILHRAAKYGEKPNRHTSMKVLIVDESQDLSDVHRVYIQQLQTYLDVLITIRDDNQRIYSYRSDRVGEPIISEPTISPIVQTESHRCCEKITNLASAVGDFDLTSAREYKAIVEYDTRDIPQIVPEMASRNKSDSKHHDLFILCRTRRLVYNIQEILIKNLIDYETLNINDKYDADQIATIAAEVKTLQTADGRVETHNIRKIAEILDIDQHKIDPSAIGESDVSIIESLNLGSTRETVLKKLCSGDPLLDHFSISVGTIHASKGLEADSVLLLDDWISSRDPTDAEERRIAYVGVTRARNELRVTSLEGSNQNELLATLTQSMGGNYGSH